VLRDRVIGGAVAAEPAEVRQRTGDVADLDLLGIGLERVEPATADGLDEGAWLDPPSLPSQTGVAACEPATGAAMMGPGMGVDVDKQAIRELVEQWVVWRDAGHWDRFRTVWHDDGRMMATWFQGPADEFIRVSREGFERGVRILHFLGGTTVDVADGRAIAQTKMTITQRAAVHGVDSDVVCTGRFYDFLEKRQGRWGIVLRQPIYESDRIDPVDPAASLSLDQAVLDRFPVGYRHLAYLQTQIGFTVKPDMPGLAGPEVEALYRRGADWLAGGALGER
jgi:hypothetical protein